MTTDPEIEAADTQPCPFCGSNNIEMGTLGGPYSVQCKECRGEGPVRDHPFGAVQAWNNRTPVREEGAAFGASYAACYYWPEDTAEHKALRAAYIQGAADSASPPRASSVMDDQRAEKT